MDPTHLQFFALENGFLVLLAVALVVDVATSRGKDATASPSMALRSAAHPAGGAPAHRSGGGAPTGAPRDGLAGAAHPRHLWPAMAAH